MKIEITVNSQNISAGDFLLSIFSAIFSAWDALLQKYAVRERFAKLFRILCFILAIELSLGIFLASIIICKGDFVILYLGIVASILVAVFSCKVLYPRI